MISCQKCEFKVPPKMRFALVKNFCPSCGNSLLSDDDAKEIAGISRMLHGQEFVINLAAQLSKELIQNLVYDMSIFIKFDLKQSAEQEAKETSILEAAASDPQDDKPKRITRPIVRAGAKESAIEAFKRAASSAGEIDEINEQEEQESDEDDDDSETDDRVKRLKQVYKSQPSMKRFGGISRSE